jgi:hypothetical protein
MAALPAARTRSDQIESRGLFRLFPGHLGAFRHPLMLEHLGKAVDDHVKEAANQQPKQAAKTGDDECRFRHQTT